VGRKLERQPTGLAIRVTRAIANGTKPAPMAALLTPGNAAKK